MAVPVRFVALVLVLSWASCSLAGEWSYTNASGHRSNDEDAQGYTNAVLHVNYTDSTGTPHSTMREEGRYGRGQVFAFSGMLIHLGRNDAACTPHLKPHIPPEPWIALVERGECKDDTKVENAWHNNAAGVILYNRRDSAPLEKMHLSERNISGVLIVRHRGDELIRLLDNGTRVLLTVTAGSFVHKPYTNINRTDLFVFRPRFTICDAALPAYHCVNLTSVLFVSISFIVLMIISLAWLVFYYVQRFRYIHAKDRLSRRLCSAAKKALSKIPTKNIKSEDKEIQGDGECCAVCIEPYKVSDVLRILPCKHEFHRSCIDPWLLEHRTCPMCKMDILKHYGFVFTGSQESILHMDIEEVVGLGTGGHDTDSLHRRSISPMPHIRPVENQMSSTAPASPELSNSSRASSPDEMSPSLSSMRGAGSSTDPVPCVLVCRSCGSDMAAKPETTCRKNDACDVEDCEVESCNSSPTDSPCQLRSHTK